MEEQSRRMDCGKGKGRADPTLYSPTLTANVCPPSSSRSMCTCISAAHQRTNGVDALLEDKNGRRRRREDGLPTKRRRRRTAAAVSVATEND
uniref:Uncharacterized protein n=1 Tax=Globodera rostochiensis TaxID=31243 RepID=A0A914HFV2_GLORO